MMLLATLSWLKIKKDEMNLIIVYCIKSPLGLFIHCSKYFRKA